MDTTLPRDPQDQAPGPGPDADWLWLGRLCARLVRDPGLADDARQEAWMAATRASGGAPDRRGLARALKRFLWRTRRAEDRRVHRERAAARHEAMPSASELVARGEQQRRVLDALLDLEEPYRSTLLARFQDGLEVRDIAAATGERADTVRWRVRRGLELLRARLEADRTGGGLAAVALGVPGLLRDLVPAAAAPAAAVPSLAAPAAAAVGGLSIMKTFALVAGLLATLWIVRGFMDSSAPAPAPEMAAVERGERQAEEMEVVDLAGVDAERDRSEEVVAAAVSAAPVEAEGAAASVDDARFIGRVVDESGEPVAGAVVFATAWRGFDLETRSLEDGRFVLEVPADPALSGRVGAHGGEFTTRPEHRFGPRHQWERLGPLRPASEGVFDLGDLELLPAGVVTGRLVSSQNVGVGVGWIGTDRAASSVEPEADGSFRIPHVGPGRQTLDVIARGMLDHEQPVEVEALTVTDVGQVLLDEGPRVSGRVVDAEGRAIPDAEVSARGFTRAWVFDVEADGTFDVPMPEKAPKRLYARADGYIGSEGITVEPGSEGVEIVLTSSGVLCTLLVVDQESGLPLETVGLSLGRGHGAEGPEAGLAWGTSDPWMLPREGGRLRFRARPRVDAVEVHAPGHVARTVSLTDAAAGEGQRIELRRRAQVRGRIVAEGRGVEGAKVILVIAEASRPQPMHGAAVEPFPKDDPRREVIDSYSIPDVHAIDEPLPALGLSPVFGLQTMETKTDESGHFAFEGCEGGLARVVAVRGDRRIASAPVAVPPTGEAELGDFELRREASLVGTIDVPPGTERAGYRVEVVEPRPRSTTTDAAGTFRFDELPSGPCMIRVHAPETVFVPREGRPWGYHLSLAPGEVREAAVPVGALAAARVTIGATINGVPFSKGSIAFAREGADWEEGSVRLDEAGEGLVTLPADVPLRWTAEGESMRLEMEGTVTFPVGTSERRLQGASAALEVVLPADLEMPERVTLRVGRRASAGGAFEPLTSTWVERVVSAVPGTGQTARLDLFPPMEGECEFTILGGEPYGERPVLHRRVLQVGVQAGQTARIEL